MRLDRRLALAVVIVSVALLVGACSDAAPASPSPGGSVAATPGSSAAAAPSGSPSAAATAAPTAVPTPLPADPAEAVIPNVEQGASITFWTFYLSPTIDQYIHDTIDRFERTYPGVEVKWEDHKATFRQDLDSALANGAGPDVVNLSAGDDWVREYAAKGLLLGLDAAVPAPVRDGYFPGLWRDEVVKDVKLPVPVVPDARGRAGQPAHLHR